MRRVLVLAYHFPPVGGAGVQRPTRMVRYLRENGYEPVVVTGPGASLGRWTPEDETLLAEVPEDLTVARVPGPEPSGSDGGDRLERWLGRPSPWSRWWIDGAVATGLEVGKDVDLIYAWMQPYQSAAAAARLAAALRRPWVADLGDPWALDEMVAWPTRWHARWARARMGRALASAGAIAMSTPEAVRQVKARIPRLAKKTVLAVPNGFDSADFSAPAAPRDDDGTFRIVHTGYLHTELGQRYQAFSLLRRLLGGRDRQVNVLTRSHVVLLEAVDRLLERDPALAGKIEVHLAGVLSPADHEVADRSAAVRKHGYVSHGEAVALMKSADMLFLPMHDLPPGRRATIVPGKTYDYLAARRPILAAVPDGDARDLLVRAGNAAVCRPADVQALATALAAQIRGDGCAADPDPAVLAEYEYRRLAEKLAGVFDDVVAPTGRRRLSAGGDRIVDGNARGAERATS